MADYLIPFTEQEVYDLMEAINLAIGASVHDNERQQWAVLYQRLESWLLTPSCRGSQQLFPDILMNDLITTLVFSASDAACYKWPEDTELGKACRAAFCDGAVFNAAPNILRNPMQITETAEQTAFQFLKVFLRDDQGLVEEWRSEADRRYSLTLQLCQSYMDKIESDAKVIAALRKRERAIIDQAWGYACGDGSVPSTEIQDKIIAAFEWFAGEESENSPRPANQLRRAK